MSTEAAAIQGVPCPVKDGGLCTELCANFPIVAEAASRVGQGAKYAAICFDQGEVLEAGRLLEDALREAETTLAQAPVQQCTPIYPGLHQIHD